MIHRDVPYDAEIEYLESTGTQYIDTGILTVYNDGRTYKHIANLYYTVTNERQLNGANGTGFFGITQNGKFECAYIQDLTISAGNNWHNINFSYYNPTNKSLNFKYQIDNQLKERDASVTLYDYAYAIYIFAIGGRDGAAPSFFCKERIKSYQIYIDEVLVRNFIPVRVGSVGYLFDKVSGQLFGNSGTGSFILGPDVAPGRYANEVAFLESWGNQYIDTGIKPSTDTKIELKCLYCKSGAGLTNYGALIGADDRDNAYILNHSAVANFTYGIEFSNNFANPQTRLLTFDSTASPQNMRVYDEGGSLVTTLTCLRGVFEVNQNLYLFAVNRNGTPVYGSNRILYCKIYDGDTLVRDYVPVEYNGIGYMYDKVSGLFFDNQGTGKFLFGSIAKACARSYTRRQLLSMYAPASAKMSLLWNQMETDGNFETGNISAARYATYSVSDNVLTISRSGTNSKGTITPDSSWYSGNKYKWFVSLDVYETVSCSVNIELSDRSYAKVISTPSVAGGNRIASVIYMNHLNNSWMRIVITSTANGAYAKVGKFWAVNLTRMFGTGKEPTADEFITMFPYSYYLKNSGQTIQGYKLGMGMFSVQPNHL